GRQAAGVIGIRPRGDDRVVAAEVVKPENDLLVVSANGYGKRTEIAEFRLQSRGGHGVTAMRITDRNGPVAAARVVTEDHTVMLVSERGLVIRVPASQISRIGRSTQGVGIMRVQPGDRVASITLIRTEEENALADLEEASANPSAIESHNGHEASPIGDDGTSEEPEPDPS
ncbi:MAG TPA: DNA gyrase C-terminal beta-propeller domain-containing protein, partial [Thermomicrobiaceae bacterium]|nr:DNA gyrase C-terminal beta-propeller domain-containing protein [Thermomicrobiaceae bacterium]